MNSDTPCNSVIQDNNKIKAPNYNLRLSIGHFGVF